MKKKEKTKPNIKHQAPSTKKIDYKKLAEENLRGWQRAKADYENLVKRTRDDIGKTSKSASKDLVLQILPVIDNFDHALAAVPTEIENDSWAQGILFIRKQLLDVLEANSVKAIESKGKKFDPELHEAVQTTESRKPKADKKTSKQIIKEEIVRGYTMNGEVIRPAKVKVGN